MAHLTGQNISTVQGDTEHILVILDLAGIPGMDIETCYFDWVVYKQTTGEIVLERTTVSGIVADNVAGELTITIHKDETDNLLGHYLHLCKMIDLSNEEYTVFTGTFNVDKSPI